MPTYRYKCSKGHEFEFTQSIKAELSRTCEFKTLLARPESNPPCGAPVEYEIVKPNVVWRGGAPTPRFHE